MKNLKKPIIITVSLLLVGIIVIRLIAVKVAREAELKAMVSYSGIVPVEVARVQLSSVEDEMIVNGIFKPVKEVIVVAKTGGTVLALKAHVGDYVLKGQLLATIESTVLSEQIKVARLNVENTKRDLERFEIMVKGDAITPQQLEAVRLNHQNALANLTALNKEIMNTNILSPVSGYVSERLVEKGSFALLGSQLFTVNDQSNLLFTFDLSEFEISKINKDQKINIYADILKQKRLSGQIREVSVTTGLAGNYEVQVLVPNESLQLRSGMGGKAIFSLYGTKKALVIPRKCITGSLTDAEVFVVKDDSIVVRRVAVEIADEGFVIVNDGLKENELVVLSGTINLEQGTRVNILNKK